jgi:hypothetical protein
VKSAPHRLQTIAATTAAPRSTPMMCMTLVLSG